MAHNINNIPSANIYTLYTTNYFQTHVIIQYYIAPSIKNEYKFAKDVTL